MDLGRLSLDSIDRFGEYPAVHFGDRTLSNVEQDRYASALAGVLASRGVEAGDRVVLMMPNGPEIMAAFQSIWKLGAVALPVMPQWGVAEVRYLLEDSRARVAVTQELLADRVTGAAATVPRLRHVLALDDCAIEGAESVAGEVAAAVPLETLADRKDDDLALLLYTSGTTGRPKGVMLSHHTLYWTLTQIETLVDMPEQMPTLHFLPLAHSYGVLMMGVGFIKGIEAAVMTHWDT
jgi:long-chain acyl-CoA synthetase